MEVIFDSSNPRQIYMRKLKQKSYVLPTQCHTKLVLT